MEILGFLFGLGCLVLIAWAIAIFGGLVFSRKRRNKTDLNSSHRLRPPKIQERNSSQPTITASPAPAVLRRKVVAFAAASFNQGSPDQQ